MSSAGRKPAEEGWILAYGDCLEPGTYIPHSSFRKACNYLRGERLLSLVSAEVGCGPGSIVLARMSLAGEEAVEVGDGWVRIQGRDLLLPERKEYRSTLRFERVDPVWTDRALDLFIRQVLAEAHPASLAFLLDKHRRGRFSSGFEQRLATRITEGWDCLRRGEIEEGIRRIRGAGFGLTPAGDDFLAGWAAGLRLAGSVFRREVGEQMAALYRLALRGNPIAWNFIRDALEGHYTQKIRDLLQAFLDGTEGEVGRHAREVLAIGETSGADFSTGLISALRAERPSHRGTSAVSRSSPREEEPT